MRGFRSRKFSVGRSLPTEAGSHERSTSLFRGRRRRLLCGLLGSLPAFGGLGAETLGETLDPALGIDQLLAAGEERMAVIADFKVQLRLRRPRLPGRAA